MMELLERIKAGAKWNPGFNEKPIPPRLLVLARFIREMWPELTVTLEPWTTSTDRKLTGTRLVHPGKGRKGKRLEVRCRPPGRDPYNHGVILRHESGEAYRHNGNVCEWIVKRLDSHPPKKNPE